MEESRAKLVNYWLKTAEEDLKVVDHLFEKGDYTWALFIAHLVLEKVLKGYYVKEVGKQAPYSHSLRYLAQQSSLELNEEQKELLRTVTRFDVEARYPSEKSDFYKLCTKNYTQDYLKRIKEFYQWMLEKF
jgi:HEPN domain-containing protein